MASATPNMDTRCRALWMICALAAAPLAPAGGQSPLGVITFPTSTAHVEAQRAFETGVLALHSFWQQEARRAFRQAQALDSAFALAYWGEALTYAHPLWATPDTGSGRAVLRRLGPDSLRRAAKAPSARERGYLQAVEALFGAAELEAGKRAYVKAMGRLVEAFPSDHEAAVLYGHALHTMLPVETSSEEEWQRAVGLLEDVFRQNPRHPGAAHYLIHAYDDPALAPRGLRAALAYAEIAPAAPHARHMPSHIFVQLGRWDETVASNQSAFEASDAWIRSRGLPLDRRDYHALDWLAFGLLMQGRYRSAQAVLAVFETDRAAQPSPRLAAHVHALRARLVVEGRRWEAASLPERSPPDAPFGDGNALFAAGLAAAFRGDFSVAAEAEARLDSLGAAEGATSWGEAVTVMAREIRAIRALRSGRVEDALHILREAVSLERDVGIPSGPPFVLKPALELLGDALLELHRSGEAADAFRQSLERTPNRPLSLLGRARALAALGDDPAARRCYQALFIAWRAADPDFPPLLEARAAGATPPKPGSATASDADPC